jgi:Tfp pilus assembly protein PilF
MNLARIEQLQQLLRDEPADAFLQHALAMEYVSINENQKAVDILTQLLIDQPDYLASYYQLGQLFEKLGKVKEACETYRRGIELAKQQFKTKTMAELQSALSQLEED